MFFLFRRRNCPKTTRRLTLKSPCFLTIFPISCCFFSIDLTVFHNLRRLAILWWSDCFMMFFQWTWPLPDDLTICRIFCWNRRFLSKPCEDFYVLLQFLVVFSFLGVRVKRASRMPYCLRSFLFFASFRSIHFSKAHCS